jgi:hypothetical protein
VGLNEIDVNIKNSINRRTYSFSSRKSRTSTSLHMIPAFPFPLRSTYQLLAELDTFYFVNRAHAGLEDDECDLDSWIYRPESAYMSESGGTLE